jgi:uncharacterized repeat protein (TIGR03803 family)
MNVGKGDKAAGTSLRRKSRVTSVVLVLALLLPSLALSAPPARARSRIEMVLHSFDGTDGQQPMAGVIQGSDGDFYGTTRNGGANRVGTVFKLTPLGALTTLYSLGSTSTDSANPWAGVIQGSDGNFYGTTADGGTNGVGTVYKVTPSGAETVLYSFCSQASCTDGDYPFAGVIQASDGNFYGTTYEGGANGDGTVFKLTPSGTLTTLYSFCSQAGCTDGDFPWAGVIQGSDGNFYGTTLNDGTNEGGIVFKLTPSGTLTTIYSFCSVVDPGTGNCLDGKGPYAGVIQGADGNFYGTTEYGGANGDGNVFKLTPSGTLTTLYSFCSVVDLKTGACLDGEFPDASVFQGSDGNFYGSTSTGTVFKLARSGTLITLYSFYSRAHRTHGQVPSGVIQGNDGNFYGTTYAGGANDLGTVFEVATPAYIKVAPTKLTLKAPPNATASASITIENIGTGPVTVNISAPKHNPPFSESGGGSSIAIAAADHYQVTIVYSPTSTTTSKDQSDSIAVTPISNDPAQKKPIEVKLKGEK